MAPFMFEGYCNTKVFEIYINNILVPILKPGMMVIIDNASFHKSFRIEDSIKSAGCDLIYLPPYSPDLNPIEHYWHKIKTSIRKLMRNSKMILSEAMESALMKESIC